MKKSTDSQFQKFLEKAKELGADKTDALEQALKKILPPKRKKKKPL